MENNYIKDYENRINAMSANEFKVLEYQYATGPAKIRCTKCGTEKYTAHANNFYRSPARCQKCTPSKPRISIEEAQKRIDEKFGADNYKIISYEKSQAPLKIKHKCGFILNQRNLANFEKSMGCPQCKTNHSRGEEAIAKLLIKWNIPFETQFTFKDLRGEKYPLRFDFAVKGDKLLLIEFDGLFHFEPRKGSEDYFTVQQKYDKMKNDYCEQNSISLLRIPYWKYKQIPSIIKNFLMLNDYPFGEYTSSEVETLDTEM